MGKKISEIYYYLRLDDVSVNMDLEKWLRVESVLEKYCIRPIVAIIPKNEDRGQIFSEEIRDYRLIVERWKTKGWIFAQHGYTHVYSKRSSGYYRYRAKKSEFAGYEKKIQRQKIEKGIQKLDELKIDSKIWVSPSGTFDLNTLKSLSELSFDFIVDGLARWPYRKHGLTWIPIQANALVSRDSSGLWGFCLHPNTMTEGDFLELERFINENHLRFSFDLMSKVDEKIRRRSVGDCIWALSKYLTFPLRNSKLYRFIFNYFRR